MSLKSLPFTYENSSTNALSAKGPTSRQNMLQMHKRELKIKELAAEN